MTVTEYTTANITTVPVLMSDTDTNQAIIKHKDACYKREVKSVNRKKERERITFEWALC